MKNWNFPKTDDSARCVVVIVRAIEKCLQIKTVPEVRKIGCKAKTVVASLELMMFVRKLPRKRQLVAYLFVSFLEAAR